MEKMNQVSVTEFMSKSKEEMYDMAVEMVEKYNRLVDICNDSAERMAEFMAKDDINEFKKELQSKAPCEFKIRKLADIVVWADGKIRDGGYNEEKYNNDGATAYCHVKANELWRIRDVALETMERQTVYSNALNQDIADKAAKIELLEKELEGRKEGYAALKELMDTKYIPIDEHNKIVNSYTDEHNNTVDALNKEIERLNRYNKNLDKVNHDLVTKVTLLESEIESRKEEVKKLNKCIMEKNESINTANEAIINLRKEQKTLVDICDKYKKENGDYDVRVNNLTEELEKTYAEKEADLKNHNRRDMNLVDELAGKNDKIKSLVEEIEYYKGQERIRTDQLRATESKVEELWKRIEGLKLANRIAVNNAYGLASASIREEDDHGREGFERYIKYIISEEEGKFKEELNKRFSEEVSKISTKRTEEELAKAKSEVKGVGRTSSGRYPWGAKVNDIPCGEDAIE